MKSFRILLLTTCLLILCSASFGQSNGKSGAVKKSAPGKTQVNNPLVTRLKTTVWKNWTVENSSLPGNMCWNLTTDKSGSMWVATNNGVVRIRNEMDNWEIFNGKNVPELAGSDPDATRTSGVAVDKKNNVWVVTDDHVARYDGKRWTRYDSANSALAGVHEVSTDASGVLWFSTQHGLVRLANDTFSLINTQNSQLVSDHVSSVFESPDKTLWISTDKGLNAIQKGHWSLFNKANSQLPGEDIFYVTGDRNGNVWAGGGGSGKYFLLKVDSAGEATAFPFFPVVTMAVDPVSNKLWVGTPSQGLMSFDGENASQFSLENSPVSSNTVSGIVFTTKGKWLSTFHGLVFTTAD